MPIIICNFSVVNIYRIVLDTTGSARDYPRGYEVTISKDGKFWSNPVAKGKGVSAITYIDFNPIAARHFRIKQTGSVKGLHWSVHEMSVFEKSKIVIGDSDSNSKINKS